MEFVGYINLTDLHISVPLYNTSYRGTTATASTVNSEYAALTDKKTSPTLRDGRISVSPIKTIPDGFSYSSNYFDISINMHDKFYDYSDFDFLNSTGKRIVDNSGNIIVEFFSKTYRNNIYGGIFKHVSGSSKYTELRALCPSIDYKIIALRYDYDPHGTGKSTIYFHFFTGNNIIGRYDIPAIHFTDDGTRVMSDFNIVQEPLEPIKPANFYRSSSPGVIDSSTIELARGESSSQLEFTVAYEDGSYEAYEGEVSYTGDGLGTAYTIENNIITVAEKTSRPSAVITAKPAAYGEDTELFTFINLTITDHNGVYDEGDSDINAPGLGPGGVGGNGSFGKNEVSDPITVPNGSTAPPISTTGMFTRYAVNVADLDTIADWLWSDDGGKAISKAVVSLIYGDPADSIISLMAFPFDISTVSGAYLTTQNLYWGNFDTGKPMTVIRGSGCSIDWGEITLEENWGNFLDYDPHTKIEMYLPWGTGFVSIDPGQCLPGKLRVVTNVDLIKGSCIHNVYGNNNCVIGVYDGHCAQQYPILSSDYAAKKAGVVVAGIASAVAGAIGGGAAAAAAGQLTTPMNPANNPQLGGATTPALPSGGSWGSPIQSVPTAPSSPAKMTNFKLPSVSPSPLSVAAARRPVTISRSGSFGEGSAFLGCQYPYIIVSRPTQSVPAEYGSHYGYPSNLYKRLGELTGYTEVSEIHLTGIGATSDELTEIESILKGGFIL